LILYYEWGFSLKEVGDVVGVSESRASQVLSQALFDQKKRIQEEDSFGEKRSGQPRELDSLPQQIQDEFRILKEVEREMEVILAQDGEGVEQTQEQEISEEIFRTFAIDTF